LNLLEKLNYATLCHRLLEMVDNDLLMQAVYDTAAATELFALSGVGGIKVRLNPYRKFLNVDDHEHFVHVFANIMGGRTQAQKKVLSQAMIRTLRGLLPAVDIISINIRDFEKATYCNVPKLQESESTER